MAQKQVQDAYIVAATRTPIGRSGRGYFKNTRPDDLLVAAIKSAMLQVPTLDPKAIEDAIIGCSFPEGEQGMNMARIAVGLAFDHPVGTRLMDSAPPAISTSASPTRMRSAAICSEVMPDAQKRFTVTPPTGWSNARPTAMRAMFMPCSPSGKEQPMMASSIALGSSVGTCSMALLIAATSRSSGRVFLK